MVAAAAASSKRIFLKLREREAEPGWYVHEGGRWVKPSVRHDVRVHADLAPTQWATVTEERIAAPDGVTWLRRSTRSKRTSCDKIISGGAPLVVYYFAGGQLDWFDGKQAADQWSRVRPHVTLTPRLRGDLEWTAGIWANLVGMRAARGSDPIRRRDRGSGPQRTGCCRARP